MTTKQRERFRVLSKLGFSIFQSKEGEKAEGAVLVRRYEHCQQYIVLSRDGRITKRLTKWDL